MDTLSPEERSRVMSAIRSRDTAPEMVVRRALWAAGWRFRVCDWRVPGHPDIVIPRCRALIEVRGCFWHRHGWEPDGRRIVQRAFCPGASTPKSRRRWKARPLRLWKNTPSAPWIFRLS